MEVYNVYRERCDLHHNLHRNSASHHYAQHNLTPPEDNDEVLDLSRRCDSVETRKTPSPYATGSSVGTDSPSPTNAMQCASPTNSKTSSATAIISSSVSPYPIYYPPIKRESSSPLTNETRTNLSQHFLDSNQTNLINSIDLIKPISLLTEKFTKQQKIDKIPQDVFNHSIKSPVRDDAVGNSLPLSSPSSSSSAAVPLIYPKILMNDGKPTRPFKAFPRDPLVIAANFAATDVLYDGPRVERYTEYRKRVLEQIRSANGGQRTVTNPKMRRANSRSSNSNRSASEEFSATKASSNQENQANSSESEDRCTESSDNDASSSTPTTTNNGNNNNNNPTIPNQNGVLKDAAYYERRRKNNAAAKKSRDRRRIKEDEIAIRAAYLERQNIELLCQLDALKAQLAQLTKSC